MQNVAFSCGLAFFYLLLAYLKILFFNIPPKLIMPAWSCLYWGLSAILLQTRTNSFTCIV